MSFEVALLIFGILLLLVGLIGKVKAKELEIGTNSKIVRVVLALLGAALMVLSFNPGILKEDLTSLPPITLADTLEMETPDVKVEEEVKNTNPQKEKTPEVKTSNEITKPITTKKETSPESTEPRSPKPKYAGTYRIQVAADRNFLHEDGMGDRLVSTRAQETDDYTRFIFEHQPDNSYRIKVKADQLYLHEDGLGDKLVSTRAQETDDFTRFFIEEIGDGSVKIKVKGSNRYWHVDGLGDQLVSTRYQPNDRYTRFYLRKQ